MAKGLLTSRDDKPGAKRTGINPDYIRSNIVDIPLGATSVTIPFSSNVPDIEYVPSAEWINTVDANPQFQDKVITNLTASGMTVKWNSPTDTANYKMAYKTQGKI